MEFTAEVQDQIMAALAEKLPDRTLGTCPLCHRLQWTLLPKYVALRAADEPNIPGTGQLIVPTVVLYCTNCGNSHFINLMILGLEHLMAPESPEIPKMKPVHPSLRE